MENPIKMDDLGVPWFLETAIWVTRKNKSNIKVERDFFPEEK